MQSDAIEKWIEQNRGSSSKKTIWKEDFQGFEERQSWGFNHIEAGRMAIGVVVERRIQVDLFLFLAFESHPAAFRDYLDFILWEYFLQGSGTIWVLGI